MTINFILENIFLEDNIKSHCRSIESIAMAKFYAACPFNFPYSEPIIDVKEVFAKGECIASDKKYKEEWVKIICLINSNDPNDMSKILTVREIIEKIKEFDGELELCSLNKDHDLESDSWVSGVISVLDGTDNDDGERRNIPENYNGIITNFITG